MRWHSKSLVSAGCVLLLLAISGMPSWHAEEASQLPKLSKAAGGGSGSYLLCDNPDAAATLAPLGLHPPSRSTLFSPPAMIGATATVEGWLECDRAPPAH